MGGYQRYEAYQDSGIEWLGEIPVHWNAKRMKFSVELINDKRDAESCSLPYMGLEHIKSWTGERIQDDNATSEGVASYFLARDVLFGKLRPYLAKVHLAEHEGLVSTEALVLRASCEIEPKFLRYYLVSRELINIVDSSTFGTKMPRASWDFIGNLLALIPPLEEQKSIAHFLDYKTAQIDALIAKKASLLKKLAEKRSALISQAVTKGLDPKVLMKDSGVEWLGEIPAHWDVLPLKRSADILDCKHKTVSFIDNGLPVASIAQVHGFYLDILSSKQTTEKEFFDMIEGGRLPREGDIIFSRNATVGAAALVRAGDYFCMGQDVCLVRPKDLDPFFLNYCFRSEFVEVQIDAALLGATFKRINVEKVKNLLVCFPNLIEQKQISRFIENQTVRIDAQQRKVEQAIDRLKEYRTALITNAVTGAIDVRSIPIPNDLQEVV